MATYPKVLLPAIELIEKQNRLIAQLTVALNEAREELGLDPVVLDDSFALETPRLSDPVRPANVSTANVSTPAMSTADIKPVSAAADVGPASAGTQAPAEAPQAVDFFIEIACMSSIGSEVSFSQAEASKSGELHVTTSGTQGKISISDSEEAKSKIIANDSGELNTLSYFCTGPEDFDGFYDRIENVEPGIVEYRDGRWYIVNPIQIILE